MIKHKLFMGLVLGLVSLSGMAGLQSFVNRGLVAEAVVMPSPSPSPSPSPTPTPTPPPATPTPTATPAATPKPTAVPQPSTSAPAPTATADTSGPVITGLTVDKITSDSATVTWQTSEAANAVVECRQGTSYAEQAKSTDPVMAHEVVLKGLKPAVEHNCRVRSTDAAGNATTSADQSFTTRGYTVVIKVVDQAGRPVPNATVELAGKKKQAGAQGEVTFDDVKPGDQAVVARASDGLSQSRILIAGIASDEPQRFEVRLERPVLWWLILIGLGGLALLLLLGFWLRRRKRKEKE